jgi:hypothetical protein
MKQLSFILIGYRLFIYHGKFMNYREQKKRFNGLKIMGEAAVISAVPQL